MAHYIRKTGPPTDVPSGASVSTDAVCPTGTILTGGGFGGSATVGGSFPNPGFPDSQWEVVGFNPTTSVSQDVQSFAVCADMCRY